MRWSDFSRQLKRRGVYTSLAAYAVASWVLLQIGEVTFEPLHLPAWTMTGLIVLVIVGFPVVAVLSWFFRFSFKGIRLDRMEGSWGTTDSSAASIAVLPFADMSPDKDQGYFCEGVAEEILNALTKIPQLRVAARSSSFRLSADASDLHKIGKQLNVESILQGSVRKSKDRLRVTAQLVSARGGHHLWSKRFDEDLKDIFEIQDEIAGSIADSLLESITPLQKSALKTTSTKSVTAYEYYLRGRQFINRFHKKDIEYARQMFRQAIDLDPEFALAWSGYADCHSLLVMYADPNDSYPRKAREASERALALDPDLAEAHAARGLAHIVSKKFEAAEQSFEKALALNPNLFQAYYYYGRARFHQGDLEEAAELFRKAAQVEPLDFQSRCLRVRILSGLGRDKQAMREASQAIAVVEKHFQWNPDDARALHLGAGSLVVLGDTERARRWLRRALEMAPNDSVLLYNMACNFAVMGDVEESLDYLERAIDNGMVSAEWMHNDDDLANLRSTPRFAEQLKRAELLAAEKEEPSGPG